jgi:tetratricopeptide (TPR) repeat protein
MVAARTCFRRRDYAEAERLLTDAIELEDNADSRLLRSEVRITMGQFARAAEDARAAIVRGAGAAGMETAAWCAYYLGEFGYALTLAEEGAALADNPGTKARCLVIAGRLLHADGQLDEADRRYADARKLADDSGLTTLAAIWLAALRCDQGRARDALELIRLAPPASGDTDQPLITRHRELALARAHAMLGEAALAFAALDRLAADGGPAEVAEIGPDGANLRAAILVSLGEVEAADVINLKQLEEARAGDLRPQLEASLIGLGESRLVAGGRRSAMRYGGEAVRARVAPYPFRWQQRGRSRLLQARLELAGGNFARALAEARDLVADSSRSGDAVRVTAARLLEAEALATSGGEIDTKGIGEVLKRAGDVLGAEAWHLTARLARLTDNAGWEALAERQLAHAIQGSGSHAPALRGFAEAQKGGPDPSSAA